MIKCLYCGKSFKSITNTHLMKHNKTTDEYKNDFPHATLSSDETISKIKETFIEKYGVSHISKLESIKEKKRNLYKLKSENEIEKIKSKREETCFSRFGDRVPMRNKSIKNKYKKSCLKNLGAENPMKNKIVKDKQRRTCLEKYGKEYVFTLSQTIENNKNIQNEIFKPKLEYYMKIFSLELLDNEYINCVFPHKWKCLKCGCEYTQTWNRIQQGFLCPGCYPRISGKSILEDDIKNFILSLGFSIIENDRTIIAPYELDIVIPEKKVAIEFCGLYWHSYEKLLDYKNIEDPKNYHLNKLELCQKNGFSLITIFEDEWLLKKEIVINRLKNILGKNKSEKVFARNCEIREIGNIEKNEFLDKFHLQGRDISKIKLGAFYNNKLVAVMTFSKGSLSKGSKPVEGIWELNRFCTDFNYRVIGIASKLLKFFTSNYKWSEIFSYADRRWSDGNLYYKMGFELMSYTKPNYWYIKGTERIHRFNMRKRKNEPKELTELIMRRNEGFFKIYDCGNLKFKMMRRDIL